MIVSGSECATPVRLGPFAVAHSTIVCPLSSALSAYSSLDCSTDTQFDTPSASQRFHS